MENKEPFLCVVTPIFDGAVESIKLLTSDLQAQSMGDFIHVLISAGESPLCQQFINDLGDSRFIYDETPDRNLSSPEKILINLGERRNLGFLKYNAIRYACFDADLKVVLVDYFEQLLVHHDEADVLITKVISSASNKSCLPRFPITIGNIDLSNFTFSKKIAKNYRYPTDFNGSIGAANDWRFFASLLANSMKILPLTTAVIAGNNTYKRLSQLFQKE